MDVLLERAPPPGYLQDWERILIQEKAAKSVEIYSTVLLFRLGSQIFALASQAIGQVTVMRTLHRIPHERSRFLQGLVNVNGRLRLCVSIAHLLEVSESQMEKEGTKKPLPMIVMDHEGEIWAFCVDEILGVFPFNPTELHNVPVTICKSSANYLKGILQWRERNVGLLDQELIAYSLRRSVS